MRDIFKKIGMTAAAIVLAAAWLLAVPLNASADDPPAVAERPVVVGVSLPLSGPLAPFGAEMKNAFDLAKERINEEGGINGRPLELAYADDKGVAAAAEVAVGTLMNQGAVMLTGGYSSDSTLMLAREADRFDLPLLVAGASADRITRERLRNVYRINPPATEYTGALEDFWKKVYKPKSVAIVYENSLFGTNGATHMMGICQENAIEVNALIAYNRDQAGSAYFRPLLAPLAADPPDVVYMVSYLDDAVALVRELGDLGVKSLLAGGAGGFTQPEFIERAGLAAEGLVTTALWSGELPSSEARDFDTAYRQAYESAPDYHAAEAYSALLVAADALRRAKSAKAADIRAALDETLIMTPFGPVEFHSYDGFERQNSVKTLLLQVSGGQLKCIWPLDLATAEFTRP